MKILIVEDHPLTARLLTSALGDRLGVGVVLCRDGREALVQLERTPGVGLIITDMCMPEMDGLGLIAAVSEHPSFRRIPIIVCTADGSVDTVVQAARLGVVHFLRKPVNVRHLQEKVRQALRASPVATPPWLEILLALGVDSRTYQNLLGQAADTLWELLRSVTERAEGPGLDRSGLRRLCGLVGPDLCERLCSAADRCHRLDQQEEQSEARADPSESVGQSTKSLA